MFYIFSINDSNKSKKKDIYKNDSTQINLINNKSDLNRLFEEYTLRLGGDRSPEETGFKPQPWRPKPEGRRE